MTGVLVTDEQLAADFGITVEALHVLRRRHNWPCVKLGRFVIRFTPEQVTQIVGMQTQKPAKAAKKTATIPGQTARSASRASP